MSTPNDGGPAFPRNSTAFDHQQQPGMSLRDYFAGQALAGILSCPECYPAMLVTAKELNLPDAVVATAHCAYNYADALLAARKGGVQQTDETRKG